MRAVLIERSADRAAVARKNKSASGANADHGSGLRPGDRGLYLSTGGFSKDAKYEADRSNIPLRLIDLDELAALVEQHYENFDSDGRGLLPLTKIYWPSE